MTITITVVRDGGCGKGCAYRCFRNYQFTVVYSDLKASFENHYYKEKLNEIEH
jgi:dephospho-CoA kinase